MLAIDFFLSVYTWVLTFLRFFAVFFFLKFNLHSIQRKIILRNELYSLRNWQWKKKLTLHLACIIQFHNWTSRSTRNSQFTTWFFPFSKLVGIWSSCLVDVTHQSSNRRPMTIEKQVKIITLLIDTIDQS